MTPLQTNQFDLTHFDIGQHRVACPHCGRGGRDKTLGVSVKAIGDAVAHCFRCDFATGLRDRQRTYTPVIKPERHHETKREKLALWAAALWRDCRPLSGVALDYLKSRRCVIPPTDGDLRWHPALKHPTGHVGPALVGLVTHFATGVPMSLHRTWITATGKADVTPNRMLLGGHTAKGGVIRLWPDEAVTQGLGLAEGIETALSLAHAYQPAWAAISAGNMASLPVVGGIECLMIAADADTAGIEAANKLAETWHKAGRTAFVAQSERGDLNDLEAA